MAATRTPLVSRPSIEASPVRRAASQASAISAIVGAVSTGDSGSAYTDTPRSVTPAVTPASSPGSTRLATTATTSHPAARIAATPTSAAARTSVATRSWPETTHTTGRPRFAATRALSASSRAAAASVKSLPTTKTLSQRAATARNRSTISDIALSSSARTSAYGTPRHASYGSGCGKRGRRRSMDGWEHSPAETTGRKTRSRSTRRASRSNSPSETAALPVPGSQLVTYSPSDIHCSHRLVQERRTALTAMAPVRASGYGTILPRPSLRGDLRGPWYSARAGTRGAGPGTRRELRPHMVPATARRAPGASVGHRPLARRGDGAICSPAARPAAFAGTAISSCTGDAVGPAGRQSLDARARAPARARRRDVHARPAVPGDARQRRGATRGRSGEPRRPDEPARSRRLQLRVRRLGSRPHPRRPDCSGPRGLRAGRNVSRVRRPPFTDGPPLSGAERAERVARRPVRS